ncbi:hypothetical protein BR63_11290 [Thermanaerosceptrum fracticalcis]|uniref:DUF2303 family protein n=1 Tax=Thermanaerosceptrum fracticalcis TaxID=1712410 RepID=A0A7G6E438_THEFR|nr:hypothetical protein [Thermanaerosceptrum fracticalcis]QNB46842.1 hypothetical protein BR63_11290 [Thermanaerosceptrum fracticalcis]
MDNEKLIVNMAPGQEKATVHIIESQQKVKDEYSFHYTGFNYVAGSAQAVIDLLKHLTVDSSGKPNPRNTIIFYDEKQVQVIVDESVQDRPQDTIVYRFQESLELQEWKSAFNKPITQKAFIDFLKRRNPEEVPDLDQLMAAVQTIRMATEISGDFIYQDNNNVTVAFKIKDAESATTFPSSFEIYIPIINESGKLDELEIELTVNKPRSEGEKLYFSLECPKLPLYWREAVRAEIETIRKELPGYLVVTGSPR